MSISLGLVIYSPATPVVKSGNIQIFDPVNSYQMVSILKGAVDRGTGRRTKITGFEANSE